MVLLQQQLLQIKGGFNIVNSQTQRRIVSTLFFDKNNFIRTKAKAIYKTRNTGTGNGMRGMREKVRLRTSPQRCFIKRCSENPVIGFYFDL